MEAHQERELRKKLDQLPANQLADIKEDAHAATDTNHPSFVSVAKWVVGIFGSVATTGFVIKAVKVIRAH